MAIGRQTPNLLAFVVVARHPPIAAGYGLQLLVGELEARLIGNREDLLWRLR